MGNLGRPGEYEATLRPQQEAECHQRGPVESSFAEALSGHGRLKSVCTDQCSACTGIYQHRGVHPIDGCIQRYVRRSSCILSLRSQSCRAKGHFVH
ncbi:hypothetical protein M514_07205 [Trichuris suis]|uniref:Uncharacterized protein n=1 Tax=Trichuris suis TaxID=68888 RepID=A0A085NC19_9BILA|nr:hypothetical protein M513_07205 [Trichuris suis]KFD67015.1 hypothetical protein M514_07205 [Trichuris suis]